jgi:AraC family transcriptional regulator
MHDIADKLAVRLLTDPPGVLEVPGTPNPFIVIHVGRSVYISCDRGGRRHRGLSVHGDIDIVPAGVPSRWEVNDADTALVVGVPAKLLQTAAEQSDREPSRVEIVNRFQTRDRQIEHIGWALKTEMETGYPNGDLYLDSLGTALSVHLLNHHSPDSRGTKAIKGGMSGHRLKQVISYIEDNLGQDLSLKQVAHLAGMSVSHCKTVFRNSVGQSIHQYVIQRRVERAKSLLREGERSISEIALETGFAHQSHLAYHMRRVLGVSPRSILEARS